MKNKLWTKDFTLIALANLLMAIAFYFMVPILPVFLSDSFSATESQIGLVLSFYTIAALLIRPFAGYALDVIGRYSIYRLFIDIYCYLFWVCVGQIYSVCACYSVYAWSHLGVYEYCRVNNSC